MIVWKIYLGNIYQVRHNWPNIVEDVAKYILVFFLAHGMCFFEQLLLQSGSQLLCPSICTENCMPVCKVFSRFFVTALIDFELMLGYYSFRKYKTWCILDNSYYAQ